MAGTIDELGITYPVAVDNDRDTWEAYGMRVQPSWAFVKPDGSLGDRSAGIVTTEEVLGLIQLYVEA